MPDAGTKKPVAVEQAVRAIPLFGRVSSARSVAHDLMPIFYDTHAHLDYPDFASDLPQVIERAQAAGITKIIGIGTDVASSQRAIQLSERFGQVFAAVGWHPAHALEAPDDLRPALRELARHPKVVAIGETGLDHRRLPSAKP